MTKFSPRSFVPLVALAACACGLLIWLYRSAAEARHEIECSDNLKQLGLALGNYEAVYHCLPSAAENGPDGML